MADRPILFSAPMVRAILTGTKTQTRRAVKPQPPEALAWSPLMESFRPIHAAPPSQAWRCPYGQPGDRLWVREAWTTHACFDHIRAGALTTRSLHYQADGRIKTGRNRAAMHMPRWASRITLEVTSVRVERLMDISDADARAEGCEPKQVEADGTVLDGQWREGYRLLWDQINGPGTWDANPWVWVVEFKRVPPGAA